MEAEVEGDGPVTGSAMVCVLTHSKMTHIGVIAVGVPLYM